MGRRRLLALVSAGALVAVGVILLLSSEDGGDKQGAAAAASTWTGVRGCTKRVEGGRYAFRRGRDTGIGPATFPYLPANYRIASGPDPGRRDPPPKGLNAHPFKSLLLVDAGKRVKLTVPESERRWMLLFYGPDGNKDTWSATFQACRRLRSRSAQQRECRWRPYTACRWRNTQFNGGIYVDFDHAPSRGRCAELIVRAAGGGRPLRKRLFEPGRSACG
jgi:hypothetical protein